MLVVTGGTVVILLVLVAALVLGGLVIPFCVGLVRGPRRPAGPAGLAAPAAAAPPMPPLGTVARIYGVVLLLYLLLAVFEAKDGFYGHSVQRGAACVDTGLGIGSASTGGWGPVRPGTSMGPATGDLVACVLHPSVGQWALLALSEVPGLLLWCGVLLMIVRLVRHAALRGPFTPRAVTLMRQLGWLILAGCVVVGALHALGTDVLTDDVLTQRPFGGVFITDDLLVVGPLRALLPIPALAGIALLSFASITKTGAVMDEELRATV